MKKLALFLSSIFGSFASLLSQDILPFYELPFNVTPFLDVEQNSIAVGDIDNDGLEDVIFFDENLSEFRHFESLGNLQFEELNPGESPMPGVFNAVNNLSFFTGEVNSYLKFADYDNDGDLDIAIIGKRQSGSSYYNRNFEAILFENNGTGEFNTSIGDEILLFSQDLQFNVTPLFIDIDLDGDLEILIRSVQHKYYYNFNVFETNWQMYSYNTVTQEIENSGLPPSIEFFINRHLIPTVFDLDQDGFDDLVINYNSYYNIFNFAFNSGEDLNLDGFSEFSDLELNIPFGFSSISSMRIHSEFGDSNNDGFLEIYKRANGAWGMYTQNCALLSGLTCDDQNDCTIEDVLDDDCECVGQEVPDSDGDGICDALDQCPDQNDNIDTNGNDIPDCLEIQNEADFEEFDDGIIGPNPNPDDQKALLDKQVQIYPNPSTGVFTIDSKLKIQHLKVYNAIGEEMPVFFSGQNQIDLSHFSNGIYFVELNTEEGILRKKLIKE